MSEETPPPTSNPLDPPLLRAAPPERTRRAAARRRSTSARAGGRDIATPLPASAARAPSSKAPSTNSCAVSSEPEVVPEPNDFKRQGTRRTLIAIASGVARALARRLRRGAAVRHRLPEGEGRRPVLCGNAAAAAQPPSRRRQGRRCRNSALWSTPTAAARISPTSSQNGCCSNSCSGDRRPLRTTNLEYFGSIDNV